LTVDGKREKPMSTQKVLLKDTASKNDHFHPKGKPPSKYTQEVLRQARTTLPFADTRDIEEQKRGLISPMKKLEIMADAGNVAWIAALRDPALGRAIEAIHRAPARDWTVARLARETGRSRSGFAAAFTATLGQTPLAYLTRWRMTVAASLLRETNLPIAGVAQRVGYRNAYAFATAFRRITGVAPGAERRRMRTIGDGAQARP